MSNGHARGSLPEELLEDNANVIEQESRRVSVTRKPELDAVTKPNPPLRNNRTKEQEVNEEEEARLSNTIDVHRLQKNIDNWTIQVCT